MPTEAVIPADVVHLYCAVPGPNSCWSADSPSPIGWTATTGAIEKIAKSTAGRKVASVRGIHVADAVEPTLIEHADFQSRKLPQLRTLMSPQRQSELQQRAFKAG